MKKKKFSQIISAPGFCLMVFLVGCGGQPAEDTTLSREKTAVPVTVFQIQKQEIAETVKVLGDIAPLYQLDIYAKVGGLIIGEYTEVGKAVSKGMVLAEVQQDIPGMEFAPVKIEATQEGIIAMDAVEVGSRVSPQQKLYTIQEIGQVYMIARVLESIHGRIKTGTAVTVNADAYPGESFSGRVAEIIPRVDPASRMGEIRILISNRGNRLKPGMSARTHLNFKRHLALVVPIDAIVRRGANRYLFVVQNDTAHQVKIETGISSGDMMEVFNSVREGERVVVIGQNQLNDGNPVRMVEEK